MDTIVPYIGLYGDDTTALYDLAIKFGVMILARLNWPLKWHVIKFVTLSYPFRKPTKY